MSVVVRDRQDRPLPPHGRLERIVQLARGAETRRGAPDPGPAAVGFAFVADSEMRILHERFSGVDATTDVLSFPDELGAAAGAGPVREPEPAYWGDVIICTDQAARQAVSLGHPYPYELVVLALHGVLHLLGHDHTRDAGQMTVLEESLRPLCTSGTPPWP